MSSPEPEELLVHARFVRGLARQLVADVHAAEDLGQETWLQAPDRGPRHAANLRGWLVRVTRRLAGGERRRAARRVGRERDWAREESLPSTAESAVRREALQRVTDAVLALEEPYHTTVLLRFYEGLEAREIAERTGVPLATVRSRLQRGLQRLRERLDAECGGDREEWCLGLVALLASSRWTEASAVGGGGAGVGTGVLLMGTGVKIGAGFVAVCVAGLLLWKTNFPGGLEAPAQGLTQEQPTALREVRGLPAEVDRSVPEESVRTEVESAPAPGARATRGALDVHVTWARSGSPAADLELSFLLWSHPSGERKRHGRTDAAGDFRLEGLLPGRVVIGTSFGSGRSVEVLARESKRVEIAIAGGFTARGRVVDAEGRGVARARLWLSEHFNYKNGFVVAETRADGSFELTEIPEARYLGALADGFAPAHLHLLSDLQVEGAASPDVELELVMSGPGGALQVSVVDPAGEPVAEAWVRAANWVAALELGNGRMLRNVPTHDGWTDELGRVELRGLAPGSPKLKVFAPGMAPWQGTAQVSAGGTGTLRVQLARECVVFGEMHTASGEPAVGARVALVVARYDPMMPMTRVDESGHYELRGLPPGALELAASDRELGSVKASLVVTPEEPLRWDARLDAGRVVAGQVLDEAGEPLSGWTVRALLGLHDPWRTQTRTDADGRFRLLDCKAGTLSVELYRDKLKERVPTLVRKVRDGDKGELLFRVEAGDLCDGGLRARFLTESGEPLAQVYVAVWLPGANSGAGYESDVQGRLVIDRLRSGSYQLTVSPRERPGFYLGEVELAAGEERDLGELRLAEPARLRVVVVGERDPGVGSYSYLSISQRDPLGGASSRYVTSVDGDELAEPLELYPGEYVARASGEGGVATEIVAFTIEPGRGEQTLELHPRRGTSVRVGVEIPQGDELPDSVTLVLRNEEEAELVRLQLVRGRERRYAFSAQLAAGRYTLEAETPDGRRVRHSFDVSMERPSLGQGASEALEFEEIVRLR